MRKTALIAVPALLISACMSTPAKRYYQIIPQEINAELHPKVGRVLYLEPVRIDPLYDDFRILYRVSTYELKYYSYEFWAKKPDVLFREAMGDYIGRKQAFDRVTLDVLQVDPGLVLRSTIRILEEVDTAKAWLARLAMDLEFLEFKSGKALFRHSFDRRLPLTAKQVRVLPAAVSTILMEELDKAVSGLSRALEPGKD